MMDYGKRNRASGAAQDFARLLSTNVKEDEARNLREKQREDSEYKKEFELLAELHADMEKIPHKEQILKVVEGELSNSNRRRWGGLAVAASLVLAVLLGLWGGQYHLPGNTADQKVDRYVTRIGVQKEVPLSDGSTIVLNTGSEALVRFSDSERFISLVRGEVYFDIARDPSRPLTIDMGDQVITVLGTAFGVRRDPGSIKITVESGKVAVHRPREIPSEHHTTFEGQQGEVLHLPSFSQYTLIKGEQSVYSEDTGSVDLSLHSL
ncbi:MAG: FecR domain-containing protein, partial [Porticoccaceae bacterium]|nr:FecR domain-containing protein [Porticoccaceae bacterium]